MSKDRPWWSLLAFWVMVWCFGAMVGRGTAPVQEPAGTFAQQVLLEQLKSNNCDCEKHAQLLTQIVELEKLRLEREPERKRW